MRCCSLSVTCDSSSVGVEGVSVCQLANCFYAVGSALVGQPRGGKCQSPHNIHQMNCCLPPA